MYVPRYLCTIMYLCVYLACAIDLIEALSIMFSPEQLRIKKKLIKRINLVLSFGILITIG